MQDGQLPASCFPIFFSSSLLYRTTNSLPKRAGRTGKRDAEDWAWPTVRLKFAMRQTCERAGYRRLNFAVRQSPVFRRRFPLFSPFLLFSFLSSSLRRHEVGNAARNRGALERCFEGISNYASRLSRTLLRGGVELRFETPSNYASTHCRIMFLAPPRIMLRRSTSY